MANQRIRIFVTGKVQGVFFRQALKVTAKKNNVFGWVRNLEDGRVEAVLEGDEEKVSRLVEWAHGGPAGAALRHRRALYGRSSPRRERRVPAAYPGDRLKD